MEGNKESVEERERVGKKGDTVGDSGEERETVGKKGRQCGESLPTMWLEC